MDADSDYGKMSVQITVQIYFNHMGISGIHLHGYFNHAGISAHHLMQEETIRCRDTHTESYFLVLMEPRVCINLHVKIQSTSQN